MQVECSGYFGDLNFGQLCAVLDLQTTAWSLILALLVFPLISYSLTFWPLCRSLHLPFGVHQLLAMNLFIWRFHIAVIGNRFIVSSWYSWPLNLSPQRALSYLLGNPVIMWGGLVALVYCFQRFWKLFVAAEGLVVLLYAANLLQWAVTPAKCTFYYYYYPAAMFLGVASGVALAVFADSVSEKARQLHFSSIVVDTHDDTTQRFLDGDFDLGARSSSGSIDIPRMKEGGL